MAATALAVRLPLAVAWPRRARTADVCGLAFDHCGGPLVAVCGLTGGAGTTTLVWRLARQAARESAVPVLACEAEALAGGLAAAAGAGSPIALGDLAAAVAAGERSPNGAFVSLQHGLRLLATAPQSSSAAPASALARVLSDARAAHGLVVCDCRTLDHPATAPLLAAASHVLWALPATPSALAHAAALIAAEALPRPGRAREALVAIATRPGPRPSVRALRTLAGERHERLILVPHNPDADDPKRRGQTAATLTQLATFLRRER